jgi:FkbM family methyltransferase
MTPSRAPWSFAKQLILRLLQTFILVGASVLVLAVTVRVYPPLVPAGLAFAGRKTMCTVDEAWAGADKRWRIQKTIQRIQETIVLAESDPAGYEQWWSPAGKYWVPAGSGGSLPYLLAQQREDIYDVANLVRRGDVVLDCGAHVGLYARKALRAGARKVIAIEPAPANLECLRRNLKKEIEEGRVIVYPKGVWDREEILPLFEDPDNSAADSFVGEGANAVSTHTIPLTRIDTLVEELGLVQVDVIKMDIKGAALRALRGAQQCIARDSPQIIISTEEAGDDALVITKWLGDLTPSYLPACGTCSLAAGFMIEPEVVFYQPGD